SLNGLQAVRRYNVISSSVGGPPDSKHLDGTNYSDWKFAMKNYRASIYVEKQRARLVPKGENLAPTMKTPLYLHYATPLRLLLSLAVQNHLYINQIDVATAFLNTKLKEEIHMELSGGVVKCQKPTYCPVKLSVVRRARWYAAKVWREKAKKRTTCLYCHRKGENMSTDGHHWFEKALHEQSEMKDVGEAPWCLRIRINHDKKLGTLSVDQERHIEQILERFGMVDSKMAKTPLESILFHAQQRVGTLLYLSQTSLSDICYAMGVVGRYSNDPGKARWVAIKRIMKYLKAMINMKLIYKKVEGVAISWNSKKQRPTAALLTTEAEYRALGHATPEMIIPCEKSLVVYNNPAAGRSAHHEQSTFTSGVILLRKKFKPEMSSSIN
ncbi:hypothetical protein M513_06527, partial [Trichuris suis]